MEENIIWKYGESGNAESSYRIQLNNLDRKDKRKIMNDMLKSGWDFSGEGHAPDDKKKISLLFTRDFSSKALMVRWAKKFPRDLYFENRDGSTTKINNKGRKKKK